MLAVQYDTVWTVQWWIVGVLGACTAVAYLWLWWKDRL